MTRTEAKAADSRQDHHVSDNVLAKLTPREREILDLIGRGLSTAEIAQRLHRSQKTIKSHRLALGRKLRVSNRVELARIAIEAGLAPLRVAPSDEATTINRRLRNEIATREQAQHALRAIDAGTATAIGEDFFRLLVQHLAQALQVKYALVCRLDDRDPQCIRTIATWIDGAPGPDFSFMMVGTPCEHAVRQGSCFHRSGVRDVYALPEPLDGLPVESYLGAALQDRNGASIGVLAVVHDGPIDEAVEPEMILRIFAARAGVELQQLAVENDLRHSESLYADAQRIAHVGHFDWDVVEDRVEFSAEVRRILGMPADQGDLTFEEVLQHVHPDDREAFARKNKSALESGRSYHNEFRIIRPDGDVRHLQDEVEVTRDETGRAVRFLGTVQDITEQKAAEAALEHSERFARATLDGLSSHIAIVNRDGMIEAVNAAWRTFAADNGIDPDRVSEGVSYFDACAEAVGLDASSADQFAAGIRDVFDGIVGEFIHEYPCREPERKRWFLCRVTLFPGADRDRVVIAHEDITARKQSEDAVLDIAEGFAAKSGSQFFNSIVVHLSETLQADFAAISAFTDPRKDRVRTIAVTADGALVENFEYDLRDSPCAQVAEQLYCTHPRDVQSMYAEDHFIVENGIEAYVGALLADSKGLPIGIMTVLFRRPLEAPAHVESMLKIYAVRVAAELERMQVEERIRESERFHRLVADNLPSLVAYLDADWRYRYANGKYLQWFDLDLDQLIGRPASEILSEESYQGSRPYLTRAFAGEAMTYERQAIHRETGQVHLFSVNCTPDFDEDGTVRGAYFVATDIKKHGD